MSSLWTLKDVSLTTRRTKRLESISLDIPSGVTAVLGFSGAGKTSLLNLLVEFEEPTSGGISTQLPNNKLPVFWVPQNGGLWNHLTAAEHIAQINRTDKDWLAPFDLSPREKSKPAELSQGERARLSVARALATNASVLVMDEPLAHVDPGRVASYFDVIFDQVQSQNHSLIFATHQPELVLRYANHVVCLDGAACVFAGEVADLYEKPANSKLAGLLGPGNWLSSDEFFVLAGSGTLRRGLASRAAANFQWGINVLCGFNKIAGFVLGNKASGRKVAARASIRSSDDGAAANRANCSAECFV